MQMHGRYLGCTCLWTPGASYRVAGSNDATQVQQALKKPTAAIASPVSHHSEDIFTGYWYTISLASPLFAY